MKKNLIGGILMGLLVFNMFGEKKVDAEVLVGNKAPLFELKTHENKLFKLSDQKEKGWTVLFFYPKAFTPGCTKQVCSYRDHMEELKKLNVLVLGVSRDTVEKQAEFHFEHHLTYSLLADPEGEVIKIYGETFPLVGFAKRWTFLIDKELIVRAVFKDVDPTEDAQNIINFIKNN